MNALKRMCACLLAAAVVCAMSDAMAQFGGSGMRGSRGGGQKNSAKGQNAAKESPDQLELLLGELHEDLHLTSAQEAAWESYADKIRALSADFARDQTQAQSAQSQKGTAPEQIGRAVDIARDRMTAMEDIADAAKALYTGLSPEQKTMADARLARIIPTSANVRTPGAPDKGGKRGDSK
jgi:hypothetical protein